MAPNEFTLEEAQAKRGQIVRSRPSVPWQDGVIGEIVDVGFAPFASGQRSDRVVFTIAWQLFSEYGAVPCTAMPLSKSQYQDAFQEIWLTEDDQHNHLFGEQRTGRGYPAAPFSLDDGEPSERTRERTGGKKRFKIMTFAILGRDICGLRSFVSSPKKKACSTPKKPPATRATATSGGTSSKANRVWLRR